MTSATYSYDKNVRILANSCCDDGNREVVCEHDVRDDKKVHVTSVIWHQDNRILLNGLLELEGSWLM